MWNDTYLIVFSKYKYFNNIEKYLETALLIFSLLKPTLFKVFLIVLDFQTPTRNVIVNKIVKIENFLLLSTIFLLTLTTGIL